MLATLLLPALASAEPAMQFIAKDFNASAWNAVSGTATWQSVHPATNGWSLATKNGGAVWFHGASVGGGGASPLRIEDSATCFISHAFAVVYCDDAADYSTLLDAPCPVAFEKVTEFDDAPAPPRLLTEVMLCNTNAVAVNGEDDLVVSFKPSLQLLEARFDLPCALDEIFLGGSIVSPAWNENWRGGVSELILCHEAPTDAQRNAVRRYLSARHSLRIATQADSGIIATLAAMGIDDFGVFNSVIMVR